MPRARVPADHLWSGVYSRLEHGQAAQPWTVREAVVSAARVCSGCGGLERFVRKDPLRKVHECVFGVLALGSEEVDPRL